MNNSPATVPARSAGRVSLLMGVAVAMLGVIAYGVQIAAQRLFTPWYLPCTATVATPFLVIALWQRRSVWRVLALVLVAAICAAEWGMLVGARLPEYTGPVAVGQPFPTFATQRADGMAFTQRDLAARSTACWSFSAAGGDRSA